MCLLRIFFLSVMANLVEIVVQAKDQASGSIDKIATGLQAVGVAAGASAEQIFTLNRALFGVGEAGVGVVKNLFSSVFDGVGKVLSVFGGLYSGFETIRGTLESPLGQTFFSQISEAIDEIVSQSQKLSRVAGDFSSVFSDVAAGVSGSNLRNAGATLATDLSDGFRLALKTELINAFDEADRIIAKGLQKLESTPKNLANAFGGFANAIEPIAGAAEPLGVFELIEAGVGASTNAIFELSQKLAFLGLGFQALQGLVQNGPFDLLIGQNIRLQEQLLSTQASLAATNKILQDGAQISDPTQAIKALGPAVDQAIAKIRKDSLELVGVTSKDLVDLFQIVAGQASNIGANLDQSADIVTSTAAALGTLGVPLFQARQEITSIVQGTIDQNSVLAKNLNINNEMVGKWKAQGTFVDELLTKLEAFKAGNKLASQTIGGITSNIQELFDEIGRSAGSKFLTPIVKELDSVYQFLNANKETIGKEIEDLVEIFASAVGNVTNSLKILAEPFFKVFANVPEYLFKSLNNFTKALSDSIALAVNLLTPALNVFAQLAPYAGALGGAFLALSVGSKTLSFAIGALDKAFNILAVTLPNIGEALFFIEQRNNGLLNKFSTLTDIVGRGSAGFLIYGENLLKIPGAANAATGALSKLLGGLAPFAPALTGLIPAASGIAIKIIGLTQVFPEFVPVLQKIGGLIPSAIRGLGSLAGTSQVFSSLSPLIGTAADKFEEFVSLTSKADKVNELFSNSMRAAGSALRDFVVKTAVLGAGTFAAFVFFDQLILKNKGLQKIFQSLTDTIRGFADAVGEKLAPVFNLLREVFAFFFQFTKDADGRGGNLFGNIVGGLFLAIATVKLFGESISSAFKGVNSAVNSFGDNLVASVGRIEKVRKSVKQILGVSSDPTKRTLISAQEAPAIIGEKQASISDQVAIAREANRRARDASLSEAERLLARTDSAKALANARALKQELNRIDVATPLSTQISSAFKPASTAIGSFFQAVKFQGQFAFLQVQEAFDTLKKSLGSIPSVGKLFQDLQFQAQFAFLQAGEFLSGFKKNLLSIPAVTKNLFQNLKNEVQFAFLQAGESLGRFRQGVKNVPATLTSFFAGVQSGAKKAFSDIGTGFASARSSIGAFFSQLDLRAGAAWTKFSDYAKTSFKTIGSAFLSLASELGPSLLIGGAIAGFTSVLGEVDRQARLASSGVKDLAEALRSTQTQVDILTKAQSEDASKALQDLTAQRKAYIASVKDESRLKDDPTLKLYDSQIEKLQKIRLLQETPQSAENKLRQKVVKDRDNFGTRLTEGAAITGDAIRSGLSVVSFGVTDKLGLGDRAGNLQEKEVETVKAQAGERFTLLNQVAEDAKSKVGIESQKKLSQDLARLEQERFAAEATGNSARVAQIDLEIDRAKKQKEIRLANIDAAIKEAEATQDVDGRQSKVIANLKDARKAIENINVAIAQIDLPRIGNAIEQATSKYSAALDALNKSAGDPALFKAKLTELLETATTLQDAGILRADEVAKTFGRIATNVSADRDLQIKAQQAITEAYNKEAQKRIATIDAQQAQIKALVATGQISESQGVALTSENEQKKIQAQLDADEKAFAARKQIREKNAEEQRIQITRDRQIAEAQLAASSGDPSKVKALRQKEEPILTEKISSTSQELKDAQARQKALLDLKNGGLATPETETQLQGVNDQVTQLTSRLNSLNDQKGKLDSALKLSSTTQAELDDVINQIDAASSELEKLKSENAKTNSDFNTVKDAPFVDTSQYKAKLKEQQDAIAAQQAKLDELKTKREQFQSILTANPEQAKSAQAAIADADKKELDRRKSLELQATEEQRKQDDIRRTAAARLATEKAEAAIRGVDIQIKETLAAEKIGETQRLAQIAQLRKSGIKIESEIRLQETAERKRSITLELQLEQQKQKQIEDLKKKGVGVSRETENANRLKVAELTKQLAEAELAAIEALVSAVRDRLVLEAQKYAVTIEQQNLKLERQKLLFNALEKGLENQARLAESANKLSQSTVALRESEFNALNKIFDRQQAAIRKAGGEGNFADLELEEKKLILAEKLAVLKLNSLKEQQKFEAESLEREIQKRDLLLERKKVENDIAIAKKQIDIASQEAAIKSAELEVKLRPQSEEAKLKLAQAQLAQQRNFLELGGLQQEKGFIGEEARVNEIINRNDRLSLGNKQQAETNSAIGDVIGATRDPALQERLQQQQLARLTQNTGAAALTATDVSNAVAAASQPINVRGASFKNPTSGLLGQVERGGTFTAAPVAATNEPFATSFEELQRKYSDKGVGSIEELNKKFGGNQASTFEELNAKYNGSQPKTEQAIASSFDNLTKQIDDGFSKVLVAPDLKVKELTAGLEAEFDKVSKKISENPVQLKIDDKALEDARKSLEKPIALLDESQLQRAEALAQAFGSLGKDQQQGSLTGSALGANGSITVNAPISINPQSNVSSAAGVGNEVQKAVNNKLDTVLKRVANITSGVR